MASKCTQVEWAKEQGSTVKKGECLVQFRMEYLSGKIEKKEAELAQLELQAWQQQVSAREPVRVPASAGAGLSLSMAQQELAAAQEKTEQARAAYEEFLSAARNAEGNVDEAYADGTNEDNSFEERKREIEAAVSEAEAAQESARRAVNEAQSGYEFARQEDEAQNINAANAAESARLGAASLEVQVQTAEKELEKLKSYERAGGKICAEKDVTVLQYSIQAGTFTSGSETVTVGSGGFPAEGSGKG